MTGHEQVGRDPVEHELVERELAALPTVGGLYRRALVNARTRATTLPAVRLTVAGVPVELDAVAGYVRVCGFTLADDVPAAYPAVLGLPLQLALMSEREFPLPMPGLVHTANEITQHRPVRVGERVRVSAWAADLRAHDKGALVDVHTEVAAAGETVWSSTSTYLARGFNTPKVTGALPEPPFDELRRAPRPLTGRWRIRSDAGRRYAAVSGDVNPIHLSAPTARLFGFSRPIAHGMWVHARSLAHLEGRLPDALTARVRFRAPVLLPSTVHVHSSFGRVDGREVAAVEVRRPDRPPEPGDDRALNRTTVWAE